MRPDLVLPPGPWPRLDEEAIDAPRTHDERGLGGSPRGAHVDPSPPPPDAAAGQRAMRRPRVSWSEISPTTSINHRQIGLLDVAAFEASCQSAVRLGCERKHHHAGCAG